MYDVVVIGGGVIGLSVAYELAGQGVAVCLVDQGAPGQEASWAGAGMLPPANPDLATSPARLLRGASHRLWEGWSQRLISETGIATGYIRCGGLEVLLRGDPADLNSELHEFRQEAVPVESLTPSQARLVEPELSASVTAAYRLPEMGQVRNPRHLKALLAGCLSRGVVIHPGTPVVGFDRAEERITNVMTSQGPLQAGQYVVAGGAWSAGLLSSLGWQPRIRPVRGQMLLLNRLPNLLTHIVNCGSRYLVPRGDGRILVGSTEEAVGFDKRNTATGVRELLEFATELVPGLAAATLERSWAGLRPHSADGLPYLGGVPGYENLWLAAGHFRDGLQLSPITAVVITELILNRLPRVPLQAFAPDRAMTPEQLATASN